MADKHVLLSHNHPLAGQTLFFQVKIESVSPADDDVHAVYQYLISEEGDRQ